MTGILLGSEAMYLPVWSNRNAIVVFFTLAEMAEGGVVEVSRRRLATMAGLTEKPARDALKALENAGLVEIDRSQRRAQDKSHITICGYGDYKLSKSQKKSQSKSQTKQVEEPSSIFSEPEPPKQDKAHPTIEEVRAYCRERGSDVDPEYWFSYYESNGWKVGKNPMRDWRACVRTWERNGYSQGRTQTQSASMFRSGQERINDFFNRAYGEQGEAGQDVHAGAYGPDEQ